MNWILIDTLIGIFMAFCTAMGFLVRKMVPTLRRWSRFGDAIMGVPAEGHNKAQPGLLERMDVLGEGLAALTSEVSTIKRQVQNGHPTNLRDDIDNIHRTMKTIGKAATARGDAVIAREDARDAREEEPPNV